jgi:hypothetical protein
LSPDVRLQRLSSLKKIRLSDLTDVDIVMVSLDTGLFPGVSSSVQVHGGFRDEHEKAASTILTEVKRLMSATGSKSIVTVSFSNFFAQAISDLTQ